MSKSEVEHTPRLMMRTQDRIRTHIEQLPKCAF